MLGEYMLMLETKVASCLSTTSLYFRFTGHVAETQER